VPRSARARLGRRGLVPRNETASVAEGVLALVIEHQGIRQGGEQSSTCAGPPLRIDFQKQKCAAPRVRTQRLRHIDACGTRSRQVSQGSSRAEDADPFSREPSRLRPAGGLWRLHAGGGSSDCPSPSGAATRRQCKAALGATSTATWPDLVTVDPQSFRTCASLQSLP
jgi:hypothetical protein